MGARSTNGDAVRSTIQTWVLVEVAGAQLEADGTQLTDDELAAAETALSDGLPGFADLSDVDPRHARACAGDVEAINGLSDGAAFVQLATDNADIYIDPRFGAVRSAGRCAAAGGRPPAPAPVDVPAEG